MLHLLQSVCVRVGSYAVAINVAGKPTAVQAAYDVRATRSHLKDILQTQRMSPFPQSAT